MQLDQLPLRTPAAIAEIDWRLLDQAAARRLRELGFDDGVEVELLHRAAFGGDPLAIRIGRMTLAIRRAQARAIRVAIEPPAAIAAE
ncbi:FeoA family protein [Sphingomonas sp. 1P06PA]|uniref:FeoA family protein n=1 Tax=Sphingomonas sp. 1P06PA TaxID=554121 RepID=UPI0039A505A5